MKLISLLLLILILRIPSAASQVKISSGNNVPDGSAMLEVESSSKGLLLPRMTGTQMNMINNAAKGLLVFNTSDSSFYMHLDTGWTKLSTGINVWSNNGIDIFNNNTGKVGIGIATPLSKFHLKGDLRVDSNIYLPNSTDSTGIIYKGGLPFLHNAGLVSQQNVYLGSNAGSFNVIAKKNVAIGAEALANSDGADNIAIGYMAAHNLVGGSTYTESLKNLFVGYLSGLNATGGIQNVSLGNEAGYNLMTGSAGNVLIGSTAGRDVTTGIGNVLIGNNVQTSTGWFNTGIGANSGIKFAGGSYNCWLGNDVLKSNKNGFYNIAFGNAAGRDDSVGSYNIYIGAFSASTTQGSGNVFIGPFTGTGTQESSQINNKFILNSNSNGNINHLHLIDGDFASYKVGIKKQLADLLYTLDIGGEIRIGSLTTPPTGSNGVMYYNNTDSKMKVYENNTWKNAVYDNVLKSKPTDPDTNDVPANTFHVWKNTTNSNVYMWVNDGGVLKKIQFQ